MCWGWPALYSEIYYATYIIVIPLKYILWKLSHHFHIVLESIYEEIFIKNVWKVAEARAGKQKEWDFKILVFIQIEHHYLSYQIKALITNSSWISHTKGAL